MFRRGCTPHRATCCSVVPGVSRPPVVSTKVSYKPILNRHIIHSSPMKPPTYHDVHTLGTTGNSKHAIDTADCLDSVYGSAIIRPVSRRGEGDRK